MESSKICSQCGENKSCSEFPADKSRRDGLRSECKGCRSSSRKKVKELETEDVPKNFKFNEILLELTKINSKFREISNAINSPVFGDMDMSSRIHAICAENYSKCKDLEDEYQNILHPPKSEFILDSSELLVPFDTMNPNAFIAILQSQLQMFVVLQKNDTDVSVSIVCIGGVYTITLPQKIKLSNNEFTDFMRSTNYVAQTYTYDI